MRRAAPFRRVSTVGRDRARANGRSERRWRTTALAHTHATLEAGRWLVGTSYNLCWTRDSLRWEAPVGSGRTWVERTPAMAAGLTDRAWTLRDLLHYRVPLPAWAAPKRRGRPPKHLSQSPIILRAA